MDLFGYSLRQREEHNGRGICMKKIRFISMAVLVALLMSILSSFAFAAGTDMELKTTASVNLRKGPGTGYAKIIAVTKNREFEYTGVSKYDSRGVVWHKIEYKTGYAWVSSAYSDVYDGSTKLSDSKYVTTTASVNLRKGPGTGYGKLSTASKNTKLFYLGESKKDSAGTTWYKVSCSKGEAWVSGKYAKLNTASGSSSSSASYVKTTASVNLRKGPGLDYAKVVAYSKDKKLTYMGESSKDSRGVVWYKVSDGKNTGWVSSKYAKLYK